MINNGKPLLIGLILIK